MQIRLDSFEDAYEVFKDDILGSGQFAVVKRCREKKTGRQFAAKYVIKRRPNSSSRKGLFREKILQEIDILSELKHENIIQLHEVFETTTEIIIVLELVDGGELFEFISEKDHLNESEAAQFITQILEGVEHFHAKSIVHLDLKPENIMLYDRKSLRIKVIDFGISRKLKPGEKVMETYGTPEFVAPEIIQYQPISTATDMWSIGVITYILLSGASPFLGDTKQETFANITNVDYSFDEEYFGHTSDLAKDFISRLFVKDMRKRATVKDCLEHPWIKPRRKQDEVVRQQAQINMEHLKSFVARRRWKQSVQAVLLCNRIIRNFQLRLSLTISLENINCVSFGKSLFDNGDDLVLTALLCASEDGDIHNLKSLLNIIQIDLNRTNKNKETALHVAAANGRLEIIRLLHEKRIDLNSRDINGENAIHFCCRCSNIDSARAIITYLAKSGVSLDVQNKNGETPLHIASKYGCNDLVRLMCELGANLDIQDDQLETALHVACWNGFPEISRYLCQFGCDANLRNKEGETALIVACARGCMDSVRTLVEHKVNLNIRDKKGNTALHWAVRRHFTLIALVLLQSECNMDMLDSNGETALHIACRENLLPVVQTMCALGCRVDIKNKKEMTPLHTATEKNEIDAVRCLCLAGLDLNITNKDGLTAEQLAMNLKHVNIANLLSSLKREQNREVYIDQLVPTNDLLRRVKIKVFGASGAGKSTLIDSMKCSYINSFFRRSRLGNKATSLKKKIYSRMKHHQVERIGVADAHLASTSTSEHTGSNHNDDVSEKQSASSDNSIIVNNILDNYELANPDYTKGIKITQCTFGGQHHFSIWEYSGYEPYQLFYDRFIVDTPASIHLIVYDLSRTQFECFEECVYWIDYLRSRLASVNVKWPIKLVFAATHADMDKTCRPDQHGHCISEKARTVEKMLQCYYENDELFRLAFVTSQPHFVLDSRAAWTPEVKLLIEHLVQTKQALCQELPRCTMFLNRTLFHLQTWRKQLKQANGVSHANHANPPTQSTSPITVLNQSQFQNFSPNGSIIPSQSSTPSSTVPSTPTVPFNNNSIIFQFSSRMDSPTQHTNHYPVISWKQFIDQIRESINPLASDEHLSELVAQLQIMGEIVYLEGCMDNDDMICYEPEWLCGVILGRLFAHERYLQIKPTNLNGFYTQNELRDMYSDVCQNLNLLVDIFISLDICTELERYAHKYAGIKANSELFYEFPAFNFLSEPMPLAFHNIKSACHNLSNSNNKKSAVSCFVFNGFQLQASHFHINKSIDLNGKSKNGKKNSATNFEPRSQLASLFSKIQVHLRHLANNSFYMDTEDDLDLSLSKQYQLLMRQPSGGNASTPTSTQRPQMLQKTPVKLENLLEEPQNQQQPPTPLLISPLLFNQPPVNTTTSFSYPNTANSTVNILPTPPLSSPNSVHNYQFNSARNFNLDSSSSSVNTSATTNKLNQSYAAKNKMNGALIDLEIYQTRYCTRLKRKKCLIECLVSLDHQNGDFIEVRACAPERWREELFYFVQDLSSLIEQVIQDTCQSLHLEKHYLLFKPVHINSENCSSESDRNNTTPLGVISYESAYAPRDIVSLQLDANSKFRFLDLVCCGSEQIEKMLVHGVDVSVSQMNEQARGLLCRCLDKTDPMGRDWTILAFLLGLHEYLPKLEDCVNATSSKTDCLLNEWCRQSPETASVKNLLHKIKDLGRIDIYDMIVNTIDLFKLNASKDSGIQNSNQTLASLK